MTTARRLHAPIVLPCDEPMRVLRDAVVDSDPAPRQLAAAVEAFANRNGMAVGKKLVDTEGQLTGVRNDVALAGLNHKLGWRGTTNTLLNFGEGQFPVEGQAGAVGYLVGQPGEGLKCMFHMMNEARIGVGFLATALGYAGYRASLDYAKVRTQGRPVDHKDPSTKPVPIIEHTDVRRMLLAQKAYCEGALALDQHLGGHHEAADAEAAPVEKTED